jgi:hypothetical protein
MRSRIPAAIQQDSSEELFANAGFAVSLACLPRSQLWHRAGNLLQLFWLV